jgi:hypothetical protein
MAWRRISCFASSALGLRPCSAPSDCRRPHNGKPQFEGGPRAPRSIQGNLSSSGYWGNALNLPPF